MKLFHRLRFRTQIILCFSLVICFVAVATFGMAHTILRSNYRRQKSEVLETYSRQLSINISNRLEYFTSYLHLLSSDPELLNVMARGDYDQVDLCLQKATEEFMKQNVGKVSAIRAYRRSRFTSIDGLCSTSDIFAALSSNARQYPENVVITGTYLNSRNEKVFSIFRKVFQTNQNREYCIEMCVYETELYGFFNEDGEDTDIYLFSGDKLLSMGERETFSNLLYRQQESGGGTVNRETLALNAGEVVVSERGSLGIETLIQTNEAYLEKDYFALLVEMLPIFVTMLLISFYMAVTVTQRMNCRLKLLQTKIADLSNWELSQRIYMEGQDEFAVLADELEATRYRILAIIDENARAQEQMRVAQMRALRAQINSHFLFNSLSTIKWLALEGKVNQQAKAVDSLALFLRYSLEIKGNQVPLKEEINQLNAYAYLQSLRYGDEIHLQIDVDECLMQCQTVRMILQPLVENAIYHGRRASGATLNITIYSEYDEQYYYLMVEDDGNGIPPETLEALHAGKKVSSQSGYGLENVIERLHICLKDRSEDLIRIQSSLGEYTIITIRQPLCPGLLERQNGCRMPASE